MRMLMLIVGIILATAEHDGGWLFLFNITGLLLMAIGGALLARETDSPSMIK